MKSRWFGPIGLVLVLSVGCAERPTQVVEEEPAINADTPLVLRLNSKSQIFLHNRWVDLYSEQGTVRNYFRKQSDRYREACEEEGVALIKPKEHLKRDVAKEFFPNDVLIEVEPMTKAGSISYVQRVAHEYGFTRFKVQVPEPTDGTVNQ